ncbi:MAG: phosphoglycerate kinase [Candidatus Kerfeldbacteria bacterium]|nr:phosphoglycerate kinase [Candidatus Kerfeldbacteria bacterium]
MRTVRDIPLHNQKVFLRADFNVPLDNGRITDDTRIKAVLPTIEYCLQKGAAVVLASHLGRPGGKVVPELRLQPVAKRLSELLGQQVRYVDDCVGPQVEEQKNALKPGEVLLLENVRFYPQEEKNDLHFAEQLAAGIDVYITDAFGALHRAHASTSALPSLIFDKGIGFLIQEELEALDKIAHQPEQPLVIVVGGAKISDKVPVIQHLAPLADVVLVGGGIANTFLHGLGYDVGGSLMEKDAATVAHDLWQRFSSQQPKIHVNIPSGKLHKVQLPLDYIAAPNTTPGAPTQIIDIEKERVPEGWLLLDIGPKTQALYRDVLAQAKTIFWNGPMGLFEQEAYSGGSRAVAVAIAESAGYAVLGGGDTESVVEKFHLQGRFRHVSTGGGASLAYLAQETLPGLAAME